VVTGVNMDAVDVNGVLTDEDAANTTTVIIIISMSNVKCQIKFIERIHSKTTVMR